MAGAADGSTWWQQGYPQPGYTFPAHPDAHPHGPPPFPPAPSTSSHVTPVYSPQAGAASPTSEGQPASYDPFANWRNAISQAQHNAASAAGYAHAHPASHTMHQAAMAQQDPYSYGYWQAATVPPPRPPLHASTHHHSGALQFFPHAGPPHIYPGAWPPIPRSATLSASRPDTSRRIVHLTQGGSLMGYGVPEGSGAHRGAESGGGSGTQAGGGASDASARPGEEEEGRAKGHTGHESRKGRRL